MPAPNHDRLKETKRARARRIASRAAAGGALALLSGLPGLAAAQPYVTGQLGYANSEFVLDAPYNGVVDDGSVAYGIAVGADLGKFLGFQVAATAYGDFSGRATPCPVGQVCTGVVRPTSGNDVRTYTATAVPQVKLGRVDFFGRVGYYHARIDTETRFGGSEFTENGLLIGAGARWDFVERPLNVSIEATRFDDNLYQFTVGVGWQPDILAEEDRVE